MKFGGTNRVGVTIHAKSYRHPDAVKLNKLAQLEYVSHYGEEDTTPVDCTMFEPPNGLYLVAYNHEGQPVASGGWRSQEENDEGYSAGDAEVKRMFVVPEARGKGIARCILASLEQSACAAGRTRMVLLTGIEMPEAISLYLSTGYRPCPNFGHYRKHENTRCFAKPLTEKHR